MNYEKSGVGYLIVNAVTADGLLPVENALITVSVNENGDNRIIKALRTDKSGKTPRIAIPTPEKELSLTPEPAAVPYTTVIINGDKEGFYPAEYINAPVFPGTVTLQQVDFLPRDDMTQIRSDETVYYESEPADL